MSISISIYLSIYLFFIFYCPLKSESVCHQNVSKIIKNPVIFNALSHHQN